MRPVDFDVETRGWRKQLAIRAIKHIEETIAIGLCQHFAVCTTDFHVNQHAKFRRIVVKRIVRRALIGPNELARFWPECKHRADMQVVPLARLGVPRTTIAGAPINEVKFAVISTGQPRRRAALARGVAGPGVAALFVRHLRRVQTPHAGTGIWRPVSAFTAIVCVCDVTYITPS